MSERYLNRVEAAAYISGKGLTYSPKTLQKLATLGGGPVYRRFGHRAVYTVADLDQWIDNKLTPPLTSSSAA